jgi:hypothetical protein
VTPRRFATTLVLLAAVGLGGCGAADTADDPPATSSVPWPADVTVPLCHLTLTATNDGVAWSLVSNSPAGILELRTAPGDDVAARAILDADGAGHGVIDAGNPDVHVTAWIRTGVTRGGCASVPYPRAGDTRDYTLRAARR